MRKRTLLIAGMLLAALAVAAPFPEHRPIPTVELASILDHDEIAVNIDSFPATWPV